MNILKILILIVTISINIGGISHANIFDSLNNTLSKISGAMGNATPSEPNQMDVLLIQALKNNNMELAQRALDNGANINCYVDNKMPLEIATIKHDFDMANFLLNRGADPEGYILHGTDKHYYIFECDLDMITFFLDWGVNINIKNNGNVGLLQHVIYASNGYYSTKQKEDLVMYLLGKGIDINYHSDKDYYSGTTPLIAAINENNIYIFHALLNAGANYKQKSAFGMTPLDFAIKWNHNPEIINELMTLEGKK